MHINMFTDKYLDIYDINLMSVICLFIDSKIVSVRLSVVRVIESRTRWWSNLKTKNLIAGFAVRS